MHNQTVQSLTTGTWPHDEKSLRLRSVSSQDAIFRQYQPQLGFPLCTIDEVQLSLSSTLSLHPDGDVNDWIAERLAHPCLSANIVPLDQLRRWQINPDTGNIQHDSGKFFTITGVAVRHRTSSIELNWDQPLIDQSEIGILGILAKKINGVLHFCLQAKEEPGNINSVQLSPTVQATFSNYTQVHGGTSPPFLNHFLAPQRDKTIFAKLQSEDGGRFLFKSNRNMIILVGDDECSDLPSNFIWLTLRQIGRLMKTDNLIHACTRSILSVLVCFIELHHEQTIPLSDSLAKQVQWLDDQKAANHIYVKHTGLNTLQEWHYDKYGFFSHDDLRFFRVVGLDVFSTGREVTSWTQPILVNQQIGIIGLLMRRINGKREYLFQAKADVGNRTMVQLGPTVQFTPDNYIDNPRLTKPFLFDEFSTPNQFSILHESIQSEEGARFFMECHLHRVLELPTGIDLELPENYQWLSESSMCFFLQFGEQVNSCARSIIACLLGTNDLYETGVTGGVNTFCSEKTE